MAVSHRRAQGAKGGHLPRFASTYSRQAYLSEASCPSRAPPILPAQPCSLLTAHTGTTVWDPGEEKVLLGCPRASAQVPVAPADLQLAIEIRLPQTHRDSPACASRVSNRIEGVNLCAQPFFSSFDYPVGPISPAHVCKRMVQSTNDVVFINLYMKQSFK